MNRERFLERRLERPRKSKTILEQIVERRTRALYQEREYLQSILGSMDDALLVLNMDGSVRSVNSATCRLLGLDESELLERPVGVFLEEGREALAHMIRSPELLEKRTSRGIEVSFRQ